MAIGPTAYRLLCLYITGEKEKYDKDEYRYRRYIEINGWKNIREDIVLYCSISVNVRI